MSKAIDKDVQAEHEAWAKAMSKSALANMTYGILNADEVDEDDRARRANFHPPDDLEDDDEENEDEEREDMNLDAKPSKKVLAEATEASRMADGASRGANAARSFDPGYQQAHKGAMDWNASAAAAQTKAGNHEAAARHEAAMNEHAKNVRDQASVDAARGKVASAKLEASTPKVVTPRDEAEKSTKAAIRASNTAGKKDDAESHGAAASKHREAADKWSKLGPAFAPMVAEHDKRAGDHERKRDEKGRFA